MSEDDSSPDETKDIAIDEVESENSDNLKSLSQKPLVLPIWRTLTFNL